VAKVLQHLDRMPNAMDPKKHGIAGMDKKKASEIRGFCVLGGERGIRTPDRL
jgi:hypothetical protein